MKTLTAKLIKTTDNQRFYKLNHKLTTGEQLIGKCDLIEELNLFKDTVNPEYKNDVPLDGIDYICISDANTHLERLVFGAIEYNDSIDRTSFQIGGYHTFMIYGGDARSIKPDYVYIRRLAIINGLEFHYNNFTS